MSLERSPSLQAEPEIEKLLADFGPRWKLQPLYPFWYLRTDGLWEVPQAGQLEQRAGKLQPKVTAMRQRATGGLPAEFDQRLREDPQLLRDAAQALLDRHFEPSLHPAIASAVGLDLAAAPTAKTVEKRKRDRAFRQKVLVAYEHRCAACGWNVYLGADAFGLEAAHVFWHTLGGPDEIANGLSLCTIHHLALDLGAISVDDTRRLLVSQQISGSTGVDTGLHAFAGQPLRAPQPGNEPVDLQHAAWHRAQIFRPPARAA